MTANLLGHNLVNDPPHPGSFRVQANFLSCLLQSGTATPRWTDLQSVRWKFQKSTRWDLKPDPRLTWSPSLRSGSWGGSAPPCQCGDRWGGSLFGCNGSAVPLRGSSGSFLLDKNGMLFSLKGSSNASRLAWSDIWNSKTYHCWWPGKPGTPQERWGRFYCTWLSRLQFPKKRLKVFFFFFWKLSGEARNTVRVSLCFLCFSFLGSANCCCLNLVLKCAAFKAVLEMSHFPVEEGCARWDCQQSREFTLTGSCLNESMGGVMHSYHLEKNRD